MSSMSMLKVSLSLQADEALAVYLVRKLEQFRDAGTQLEYRLVAS